jgi:DNA-binding MarR family transcriptional regulator
MEKRLFELIMQIRRRCLQTEEKIRTELHLTPGEFNGLLSIEPGEKLPGITFSQRMGLSPSRGSRVISKMSGNGYITLQTVPENRRSAEASLTQKGMQMRDMLKHHMSECEEKITSQLTSQQTKHVTSALRLLAEVM